METSQHQAMTPSPDDEAAKVRTFSKEGFVLAQKFHEAYERLAPEFGYKTREASAKPWDEVPKQNRQLMVAVMEEVMLPLLRTTAQEARREQRERDIEIIDLKGCRDTNENVIDAIRADAKGEGA